MNIELQYPGKRPADEILSEVYPGTLLGKSPLQSSVSRALLFGDNQPILSLLRTTHRATIDLIYIDPPFGTGQSFTNGAQHLAYHDTLVDHDFLEFLRQRLILMRELLSPQGSLYLHIDKKVGHYVKLLLDEIFGRENFLNDITRVKCNPKNFSRRAYGNSTDMILLYAKDRDQHIWNEQREPLSEDQIHRLFPKHDPQKGPYTTHPLHAPGKTQKGDTGQPWKGLIPPRGRHWRYKRETLDALEDQGLIEWSPTGNPRKRFFAKDHKGQKLQDFWEYKDKGKTLVSYPTEKNLDMLKRIILQSSHPESIVLDAFAGSGSTLIAAHELGRNFIGIDASSLAKHAIQENFEKYRIEVATWRYEEK
ncbi:MAG: site-specific DNA-methyltransferase [Bacteroidota bacterium]